MSNLYLAILVYILMFFITIFIPRSYKKNRLISIIIAWSLSWKSLHLHSVSILLPSSLFSCCQSFGVVFAHCASLRDVACDVVPSAWLVLRTGSSGPHQRTLGFCRGIVRLWTIAVIYSTLVRARRYCSENNKKIRKITRVGWSSLLQPMESGQQSHRSVLRQRTSHRIPPESPSHLSNWFVR